MTMSFSIMSFAPQVTVPPPVAPDESMTVLANSMGNSLVPVITSEGVVVTPDSLSIITLPSHGVAAVFGASLIYSPSANYVGADSFTYTASKYGAVSSAAMVSVTVNLPCYGPLLEVWPAPDQVYPLRIRAYAADRPFGYTVAPATAPDDGALTQCDARLVFLMAMAIAKAHYQQSDANVYANQFSTLLDKFRAGAHGTRRYIPHDAPHDELRTRGDADPYAHWIKP